MSGSSPPRATRSPTRRPTSRWPRSPGAPASARPPSTATSPTDASSWRRCTSMRSTPSVRPLRRSAQTPPEQASRNGYAASTPTSPASASSPPNSSNTPMLTTPCSGPAMRACSTPDGHSCSPPKHQARPAATSPSSSSSTWSPPSPRSLETRSYRAPILQAALDSLRPIKDAVPPGPWPKPRARGQ